jgi:hypothetical protein
MINENTTKQVTISKSFNPLPLNSGLGRIFSNLLKCAYIDHKMMTLVVYHLHGKPIRFEIVLMASKISDRKSHSDYALPFRVTDRKALKGCLPFTWETHPF